MENYNKPTINNAIQTIASLGVENVTICCSAKIQRFLIGGGFSAGTPWWGDWINRLPSKFWDEEKPTGGRFETSTKSVSWQVMSDPLTEEQNDNLFTFFQRNDHIKLHKYVPKVVVQCVRRYGWYGFNLRDATSKIAGSKCWTTFQALREATENSTRDDVAVSSSTSRIAVLGGSFNPITCGHIAATRCLLDNDRINAIQLLPCGPRPDKRSLQSSTLERFLFCFEAIEEFFPYNVPVFACPLEVWENVAVASAELIPTLRKTFGTHFSLVIGSDLIESLPKWRNAENLTTQCSFLLLHREGVKNTIEGCEKKLETALTSYARKSSMVVNESTAVNVSSTEVKSILNSIIKEDIEWRSGEAQIMSKLSGLVPSTTIRRLVASSVLLREVLKGSST
eukprot:gb/GECG01008197.1/.p1 GENE.gb/GECG01008197.1/~~gb/GECG01008197.1/.p1  ORF type:complete len:395 (+),score=31.39 gb/GECG01008197.1/:1-1185(+)